MRESSSVASVRAFEIPALPGPGARPTRGPPASTAAGSPDSTLRLTYDHDRIASGLNDLVRDMVFDSRQAGSPADGKPGRRCPGPARSILAGTVQDQEQG